MQSTDVTLADEDLSLDSHEQKIVRISFAGTDEIDVDTLRDACQQSMVRIGWFSDTPPPTKACLTKDGQVLIYPTDTTDQICARLGIWDLQ